MAFNGLHPAAGPFTLAAGASMRIWVRRNQRDIGVGTVGSDLGAQWIMANPRRTSPARPAILESTNHAKERTYLIGRVTINGEPRYDYDPESEDTVYWVTVRNIGTGPATFDVQGGGNV
jgi:hypothetical protein